MFITEFLLVASVFVEENWSEGYHWVHIQIKGTHESLANRIEIGEAEKHLKEKEFDSAIKLLIGFEKKESEVRDIAVTNIFFM